MRHVEHHDRGSLVAPGRDHEVERGRGFETVGIPPGNRDPRIILDDPRRRADRGRLWRDLHAIDGRRRQWAIGRDDHRHDAPLHRCERTAADVLPPAAWPLEVIRQCHLPLEARNFWPMHRCHREPAAHVARRQHERTVGDLR